MPIAINNSFPSIKMLIGVLSDNENKMSMFVDTGAATNTVETFTIVWLLSIPSADLIPNIM